MHAMSIQLLLRPDARRRPRTATRRLSGRWWGVLLCVLLCMAGIGTQAIADKLSGQQACPSGDDMGAIESLLVSADAVKPVPAGPGVPDVSRVPCFVSYADVAAGIARNSVVMVDVRKPEDYARLRIPGSLNVQPGVLKTKAFLKNKHVVLVAPGYVRQQLLNLCRALHQKGFNQVGILDGGLNEWLGQGGLLQGNPLARTTLTHISPRSFLMNQNNPPWLVVDTLGKALRTSTEPYAPAVTARTLAATNLSPVSTRGTVRQTLDALNRLHARQLATDNKEPYFLVVSEEGRGYESLQMLIQGSSLKQLYFLQGGVKGYRRFIADWTAQNRRPQLADATQLRGCGERK